MILGSNVDNKLESLKGNDTLKGWGGDDTLIGEISAGIFDDGSGTDTAIYASTPARVFVDLRCVNGVQTETPSTFNSVKVRAGTLSAIFSIPSIRWLFTRPISLKIWRKPS